MSDPSRLPPSGEVGPILGRGVRSVIHAWGSDEAVKVPEPSTPSVWLREELRFADSVARAGAPVPGGRRLIDLDNRTCLVSARVFGPSMWEMLATSPARAAKMGAELARLQLVLFGLTPSYELPDQRDRIVSKIRTAAVLHGADLLSAIDAMTSSTGPMVICHGDLHPSNVMLSPDGPIIVDWFDTCRGEVLPEVARTSMMLDPREFLRAGSTVKRDIAEAVGELHDTYLDAICRALALTPVEIATWRTIQRVARLAEGFGVERLDATRADLREMTGGRC